MKTKTTSLTIGIIGTIIFVCPTILYYLFQLTGNKRDIKILDTFPIHDFMILSCVFILFVSWETFKIKLARRKSKQK